MLRDIERVGDTRPLGSTQDADAWCPFSPRRAPIKATGIAFCRSRDREWPAVLPVDARRLPDITPQAKPDWAPESLFSNNQALLYQSLDQNNPFDVHQISGNFSNGKRRRAQHEVQGVLE